MNPHRILAINRCVNHSRSFSISIDEANGNGIRLTPSKCCGQWRRIGEWPVDAGRLQSIIGTDYMGRSPTLAPTNHGGGVRHD